MGYDAACTLTFEGRTSKGTAQLEQKSLVFRGAARLVVPLQEITEARADGPALRVRFGGKTATFALGEAAARWANRITNPPSRLDKLGIKAGMHVSVLGVRSGDFERELAARGAIVSHAMPTGRADAVFYAANSRADLARVAALSTTITPSGALWVIRPKGRPEITEAETMAAGKNAGLVDVKVVSFSETHTAEKFVVPRRSRPAAARAKSVTPAATRARSRRSSAPPRRKS